MSAYVCVYRHFFPPKSAITATRVAAAYDRDRDLMRFIDDYEAGNSYFDWGDDPSFFSAQRTQGSAEHAAWGVCRPNLRAVLKNGDVVVFFCAKRIARESRATDYFFIGVGTVSAVILDRREIWAKSKYRRYRDHYNILARYSRNGPAQHETFHPYHENWKHRLASPYVLFSPAKSRFNLRNPLHVATSHNGAREVWRSAKSAKVSQLERVLFVGLRIARRLRTSRRWNAHPHINLTRRLAAASLSAAALRSVLTKLV